MGGLISAICGAPHPRGLSVVPRGGGEKKAATKYGVSSPADEKIASPHGGEGAHAVGRRPSEVSATRGSIEGVDHDTKLWHGRESASKMVHRHNLDADHEKAGTLGILEGVIFPCMANILGVLLFLRLPWIVGKAGILNGFFLVFVCCCCTFLTSLSLSAVATNGKIGRGGSYFLISRSLGPALGAGVGLCFYMANSIGAAMYFMGTVEAWEIAAPEIQIMAVGDLNNIRVTGFCILAVSLVIVAGGIKYVAKLGTVFLLIVLAVILCMYLGCLIGPGGSGTYEIELTDASGGKAAGEYTWSGPSSTYFSENFGPAFDAKQKAFPLDTGSYDFITLMALWFPAVTGIMAGSNRSADLKDAAGYIPKGTLFAQLFTSAVYLSFVLLYGCVAPRQTLLDDKFFASSAAWPLKEVVLYGVMASTIGAGLTSLVSGTRLLSAIAADGTLPVLKCFAVKPGREPRLALVASGVLCACAIAIGELNAVAPVLTMFFLMCYTCVNMSCTVLEAVNDPNWRPRFRLHHWTISLLGTILCVWMMFAISAIMAMVAILFCMLVFAYAAYNSHEVKWGDGFQGMKFQLARNILMSMDLKIHTKNWRPQLLVVTDVSIKADVAAEADRWGELWKGDEQHSILDVHDPELLKFVSQLKGGRGITILGGICNTKDADVFSEGGMFFGEEQRQSIFDGQEEMQQILHKYHIEGFGRMVYSRYPTEGFMTLVQTAGLGAFQPNCVLTPWPTEWKGEGKAAAAARTAFLSKIQMAVVFQKVVLIAKSLTWPDFSEPVSGNIDIWWIVGDGGILLLLPFLLRKHGVWSQCRTRLWVLADNISDDREMMLQELETYVRDFRLDIEVHVKVIDTEMCSPDDEEDGGAVYTIENSITAPFERDYSGNSMFGDGISRWRHTADAFDRQVSAGSRPGVGLIQRQNSGGAAFPMSRQISNTSLTQLVRQFSTGSKAFPSNPPGTIGSQSKAYQGLDSVFDEASQALGGEVDASAPLPTGKGMDGGSNPDIKRQFSGQNLFVKQGMFMQSGGQLTSSKPLSAEQLDLARNLNLHIAEESKDAELVVTNLPDMPPGESGLAYFQLVERMTKDLKRCVLVRGTATEVITAFT